MLVHIVSTHPDLADRERHLTAELREHGFDVSTTTAGTPTTDDPRLVRSADALVCLVGAGRRHARRHDGSAFGEAEAGDARRFGIPVVGYELDAPTPQPEPGDRHAEYNRARIARFAAWLRDHGRVAPFAATDELVRRAVSDLEDLRATANAHIPEIVRRIERRLRTRPTARFDAFGISMHNVDVLYQVHNIAPDHEETVDAPTRSAGGAGANTIVGLARLGLSTGVAGAVGTDADGRVLLRELHAAGVDTDHLLRLPADADVATGRTLILGGPGGRMSLLSAASANSRFAAELRGRRLDDTLARTLDASRIVHLSSFPDRSELELQESLLDRLGDEVVVSFTPGPLYVRYGASRLERIIGRTNVLFVTERSLNRLLGGDPDAPIEDRVDDVFQWRHTRGYREPLIIVVKRAAGPRFTSDSPYLHVGWGSEHHENGATPDVRPSSSDTREIIDDTGVGAAILTGVLLGLLRGRPPLDCANVGYALGMSASTRFGCRAGLPDRDDVAVQWTRWLRTDTAPSWLQRRPGT